jgi:GNAT superfamily N-acetyltransferase
MLAIRPLTPARWKDLEALFGERGACGGCWCMFWRRPRSVFERQKGKGNRQALRKLVQKGEPPGLIAYEGRTPIGWCAVAPRADYPALARSRILQPVDDEPVWSVSCLFVARPYRKRGVSTRLLEAAADYACRRGGRIVEGYPVEPRGPVADAFVWTGLASAFRRAGFKEVARRSKTRPIMRRE